MRTDMRTVYAHRRPAGNRSIAGITRPSASPAGTSISTRATSGGTGVALAGPKSRLVLADGTGATGCAGAGPRCTNDGLRGEIRGAGSWPCQGLVHPGSVTGCLSGLADSAGGMFESPLPGKSPRSDESQAMRILPRLLLPGGSGRCACPSALCMLPHRHAYWAELQPRTLFVDYVL